MTESAVYLSDDDVRGLATFDEAIDALDGAFRALADGRAASRPRQRIVGDEATFNAMIGSTADGFFGLKAYTVSRHGAPMHVLLYASDGTGLRAVLAGGWLSLLRTGSASGLSARYLSPAGTDTIGIVGAGGQAEAQIAGVLAATGAMAVKVFARNHEHASVFAAQVSKKYGVRADAVRSVESLVEDAGVIVTMTNSAEPVLTASHVSHGVHIIAAGNNNPSRAEIAPELVARCDVIVVDDIEQALLESGELIRAIEAQALEAKNLVPLAAIVGGSIEGRQNASELTLFKSQGIGLEDAAIAGLLYRRARELGRGTELTEHP